MVLFITNMYVNCAYEISCQAKELQISFDSIVSAMGSGGTYSGLTLGAKLFLPGTKSIGIGVCDDPFEEIAKHLICETATLLECDVPIQNEDIYIHYQIGPGYACSSLEGREAIRHLACAEGILVDPVYTGKALAGLFELLQQGYFDKDENILFLHTGGAGALFAVNL